MIIMRVNLVFDKQIKGKFELLINEIREKTVNPEDSYEIAAIIESLGWNDASAAETFGVSDIFELSEIIWEAMNKGSYLEQFASEKSENFMASSILYIKSFLRGSIFALPMAISVVSMLTLRFSLWSYENLSTELATSIAIGTILSFVSVGGFTQIIARRGFYYANQGYYQMAKKITYYFVRLGYVVCFVSLVLLISVNEFFGYLPGKLMIVSTCYYIFLFSNWLIITITYLLKREFTFTGILTIGIFLVFIFFKILKLDIITSQIIALFFTSIMSLILIIYFFNKEERKAEKGLVPSLPRKSVMLYNLAPYFYYGFLYFSFLFIDRVLAWSTDGNYMPYIIWFRGDYELGLDFGLLMLMIPMGLSEVIINSLMDKLETLQRNSYRDDEVDVNRKYVLFYFKGIAAVSISAAVSSILVYAVVLVLNKYSTLLRGSKYMFNHTTYFVFTIALIAYSILSVALSNAIILFSLSQSGFVIKPLKYSIIINIVVGFLATRWFGYYFAVIGLLAGTIFFCIITCRNVLKVLDKLDYYLYVIT